MAMKMIAQGDMKIGCNSDCIPQPMHRLLGKMRKPYGITGS